MGRAMADARPRGALPRSGRGGFHRLFFALWPEEAVRLQIAAGADALLATQAARGRRADPRRYHLTLSFLGDFPAPSDDLLARIRQAAAGVRVPAFEFALDAAGSFGNRSVPWWLGCRVPPAPLLALWLRLDEALAAQGMRLRRPGAHVPHVTVLRDARARLPLTPIAPIVWPVREFVLVDSRHGSDEGYVLIGRWPLAESAEERT